MGRRHSDPPHAQREQVYFERVAFGEASADLAEQQALMWAKRWVEGRSAIMLVMISSYGMNFDWSDTRDR